MTDYIKEIHTAIFTDQTKCGKIHLVLDLIEKEYTKHFDFIVIVCPTIQWNETYHTRDWIKNGDKDNLYQWIGKLSQLLARFETLFIIDNIIADESLEKRRQPLLE